MCRRHCPRHCLRVKKLRFLVSANFKEGRSAPVWRESGSQTVTKFRAGKAPEVVPTTGQVLLLIVNYNTNINTTTDGRGLSRSRSLFETRRRVALRSCDCAGPPQFFLFEKRRGRCIHMIIYNYIVLHLFFADKKIKQTSIYIDYNTYT